MNINKNHHNVVVGFSLLLFSLAVAPKNYAQLFTYEGFQQGAGSDLAGLGGGTGWQTNWDVQSGNTGLYDVDSGGLSYGLLDVNADSARHITSFDSVGRRLDVSFGGVWDTAGYVSDPFVVTQIDQGNVWGSILVRRNNDTATWDAGPSFSLHRNNTDWFSTGPSSALSITWDANTSTWNASSNGGPSVAIGTSGLGETVLFVYKLELSLAPGANNIYVWTNPATLSGPDLLPATANAAFTGLNTDQARFKAFSFYAGGSAGNSTSFDEIRFGATYADVTPVIPEPGKTALLLLTVLAGAVLVGKSRRAFAQ